MTHDYISALDSTHQRVYFKTLAIIIVQMICDTTKTPATNLFPRRFRSNTDCPDCTERIYYPLLLILKTIQTLFPSSYASWSEGFPAIAPIPSNPRPLTTPLSSVFSKQSIHP